MKLKRLELVSLYRALNRVGHLKGVKFAYACSRNISKIKPEMEALDKSIAPTDEFKEYDTKRVELVKKYAEKDEKGKPKTEGQEYVMADQAGFEKEFEKLKKANKELLGAREKQGEEYNKLLEEDVEVDLYTIKLDVVPEDISTSEMYSIQAIIEEEK